MWDASEYEIKAIIKKDKKVISELPLKFAGRPSLFATSFLAFEKGNYELTVYAYHPENGNTGIDKALFTIE